MATFGFPGVFPGGLTTGFLSIGAIQKDNGSSFGFPGAIPGGLTLGYLNIGAVQKEVIVVTTYDAKFNFRATSGYVTDGAGETYVLGETSSQTRDGHTFQWDVCGDCSRDRSTGVGSRFAGVNKRANDGTQNTWTLITLPETGYYEIRAALGDATNTASATYAYFYDDSTLIDSIVAVTASPTTADYYLDATGVTLANAAWDAGNTALLHNFASTTFKLVIGSPTNTSGETRIAHLQITKVDAPGGGDIVILRRRRM